MKAILIVSLLSLVSVSAFAQPVSLRPGSSIVINGDVVTCQGPSEDQLAPACTVKQDGNYYRMYIGTTIAESYHSFGQALAGVKLAKEAGLCR